MIFCKKDKTKNYSEEKPNRKPKMEDFYDSSDPRGISSSEYSDYEKALKNWNER